MWIFFVTQLVVEKYLACWFLKISDDPVDCVLNPKVSSIPKDILTLLIIYDGYNIILNNYYL